MDWTTRIEQGFYLTDIYQARSILRHLNKALIF